MFVFAILAVAILGLGIDCLILPETTYLYRYGELLLFEITTSHAAKPIKPGTVIVGVLVGVTVLVGVLLGVLV